MSKEKNNYCTLTWRGDVYFPEQNEDELRFCITINEKALNTLKERVATFSEYFPVVNDVEDQETEEMHKVISVKSKYNVPMFEDHDGIESNDRKIRWGDKLIVSARFKEYEYRRKKGVTAYLTGVIFEEHGEEIDHYAIMTDELVD